MKVYIIEYEKIGYPIQTEVHYCKADAKDKARELQGSSDTFSLTVHSVDQFYFKDASAKFGI